MVIMMMTSRSDAFFFIIIILCAGRNRMQILQLKGFGRVGKMSWFLFHFSLGGWGGRDRLGGASKFFKWS